MNAVRTPRARAARRADADATAAVRVVATAAVTVVATAAGRRRRHDARPPRQLPQNGRRARPRADGACSRDYRSGITPGHVAQAFRQRCAKRLPSELTACRADVVRWSSPELVCSANLTCYTSVVHLLRDPARWAISAYDFHRKSPPTEEWVTKPQDLCLPSQAQLYAESLLGDDGLAAARRSCAALVNGAAGGAFGACSAAAAALAVRLASHASSAAASA